MGKHKEKKSRKSKKHKKEKCKRSHHNASGSDASDSSNEEVVWTESGSAAIEPTLPASSSKPKADKIEDIFADDFDDSDKDNSNEAEDQGNDWLGVIEKSSRGNVKKAQVKKNILKREQESADNKVRYARELNSYFRDDSTKKFIDDPENYWKAKKEAIQNAKESSSEQSDQSDLEDQDEEPVPSKCKFLYEFSINYTELNFILVIAKLTDTERNALNAKIIKAELLGDTDLVAELKAKLKAHDDNASGTREDVQYYAKRKSKAEQQAKEEQMSVKEMYFQTKTSITSRDEAMRFVASSSKLRTNDDEYEEVRGKKKKMKLHNEGFERMRSKDDQMAEKCADCVEQLGRHLSFKFVIELKHCFVCFTPYEPFTANYCQIRSRSHATNCSVSAEEECWTELRQVMRLLASFFAQHYKCSVIFMETHFVQQKRSQNYSRRHFVIECAPIKERYEADARIYFHVSKMRH